MRNSLDMCLVEDVVENGGFVQQPKIFFRCVLGFVYISQYLPCHAVCGNRTTKGALVLVI